MEVMKMKMKEREKEKEKGGEGQGQGEREITTGKVYNHTYAVTMRRRFEY